MDIVDEETSPGVCSCERCTRSQRLIELAKAAQVERVTIIWEPGKIAGYTAFLLRDAQIQAVGWGVDEADALYSALGALNQLGVAT